MSFKDYISAVKKDIRRSYSVMGSLRAEQTYLLRLWFVFIINIICIVCIAVLKEEFPLPLFVAMLGISACVIVNILWHVFTKEIQTNMPDLFETEYNKRGKPLHQFRCRLHFVGNLHFRNSGCSVYVYYDEILFKYRKHCLTISSAEQIKIEKMLLFYRLEVDKEGKYIQCQTTQKHAEIIRRWINDNSNKGEVRETQQSG